MVFIILLLDLPAAVGLIDGSFHGIGDGIGIHDHMPLCISGSAADGLDQRGLRPEEALLIGVQDRHQSDLRDIQPLSEKIDAHQYVEHIQAHIADDLRPLQGINI